MMNKVKRGMERVKKAFRWVMGKSEEGESIKKEESNVLVQSGQIKNILAIMLIICAFIGILSVIIRGKGVEVEEEKEEKDLTVELADKGLDTEKHWRNYFEESQAEISKEFKRIIERMEVQQQDLLDRADKRIDEKLSLSNEKLSMARRELIDASLDLKRESENREAREVVPSYISKELIEESFGSGIEFDIPKSIKHYIPEGTYFTGHLLGGMAVSTALSTPDDNATPVAIKIMGRKDLEGRSSTNLSKSNEMDLSKCRIMGSAYGDISSERAIIRLEKLVCEQDGTYITSKIAGQVFGPDGLNGVKGTVISTSAKHVKNAALGGLISGFSGIVGGQEGALIGSGGLIQTGSKSAQSLLGGGILKGASNAGEKIAEYYMKQAEAMSPILTVPSGVRINTQITKGFFYGEISTHKKIKEGKKVSTSKKQSNNEW